MGHIYILISPQYWDVIETLRNRDKLVTLIIDQSCAQFLRGTEEAKVKGIPVTWCTWCQLNLHSCSPFSLGTPTLTGQILLFRALLPTLCQTFTHNQALWFMPVSRFWSIHPPVSVPIFHSYLNLVNLHQYRLLQLNNLKPSFFIH